MTHQQILEKLAARHLVASLEEDVARLTHEAMCFAKHGSIGDTAGHVMPRLMARWSCLFEAADDEVAAGYRHKAAVALCVLLHKHGFAERDVTKRALRAIDALNRSVALGDAFFRKSADIKAFIQTAPAPLKRLPSVRESITFHRAMDVVAIQLDRRFHAAYVHEITGVNESPVIEFYDGVFKHRPTLADLKGLKARGQRYDDGVMRISRHAVSGMRHVPDLACQVSLVASGVALPPDNGHLAASVGLYAVSDLFMLQAVMQGLD